MFRASRSSSATRTFGRRAFSGRGALASDDGEVGVAGDSCRPGLKSAAMASASTLHAANRARPAPRVPARPCRSEATVGIARSAPVLFEGKREHEVDAGATNALERLL